MAASSGIVGAFAANRPILANALIFAGLLALGVVGTRQGGGNLIVTFLVNALYVIALPLLLIAFAPRKAVSRIFYMLIIFSVAAGLIAADRGMYALPSWLAAPAASMTFAAIGLASFFVAVFAFTDRLLRLGVVAPFAAIFGVAGALGYFAAESLLGSTEGAAAAAIALAAGIGAGGGVSADFSKYFAAGNANKQAAAAAGHAGVATAVYALIAIASLFGVQTFKTNFGAVDWAILWAGVTAALAALIAGLVATSSSLSLAPIDEHAAVLENRRRKGFAKGWRPMRLLLPSPTALAVSAIAGVIAIIAIFEAGFSAPVSLATLFGILFLASAICFVSLRTSIAIFSLLAVGAVLTGYAYSIFGIQLPDLPTRLAALTLNAIALAHMLVSWRDASDVWRNARDITENALTDGLGRFLYFIAISAGSLFVSAETFGWAGGRIAVLYLAFNAFFGLLLAPAIMTALSARGRNY